MKKTFFFLDDVIWLFRDLTRQRPKSIFDHFYLKFFKEVHDRFGAKVQLNIFYRTDYFYGADEFTLSDMTDAYKEEFAANSDWLKFGFHAKQEYPDFPLINMSYEDMEKGLLEIKNEVVRFADEASFAKAVCSHWRPISKEGCRALVDHGIKLINATGGDILDFDTAVPQLPYGHLERILQNRQPETRIFTRSALGKVLSTSICSYNHLTAQQLLDTNETLDAVYDKELGVHFKQLLTHGIVVNAIPQENLDAAFQKMLSSEFTAFASHEQYFYPEFHGYQKNHGEKIRKACQIMVEHGYEFIFAEDLV